MTPIGPLIKAVGMPNCQSGPDLGSVSNPCTAMWLHEIFQRGTKMVSQNGRYCTSWAWISLPRKGLGIEQARYLNLSEEFCIASLRQNEISSRISYVPNQD